jgi:hypothetical protein
MTLLRPREAPDLCTVTTLTPTRTPLGRVKYAINYVLGRETLVLVVSAADRDDAYGQARDWLVRRRLFSASLQGSCRPATQDDIDSARTSPWDGPRSMGEVDCDD